MLGLSCNVCIVWMLHTCIVAQQVNNQQYLLTDKDRFGKIALIWAEKAHYAYTTLPSEDKGEYAKIQAEMKARGAPPQWSTIDRNLLPHMGQADDSGASGSGSTGNNKAGNKPTCNYCKNPGHFQRDCHKYAAHLAAQADAAAKQTPQVGSAVTDDNPSLDRALKPGSRLHDKSQQQARDQSSSREGAPVCPVCTKINGGKPVKHWIKVGRQCVLTDPEARPPPNYNSDLPLMRKELNRRRLNHGMGALPPFVPRNPPGGAIIF